MDYRECVGGHTVLPSTNRPVCQTNQRQTWFFHSILLRKVCQGAPRRHPHEIQGGEINSMEILNTYQFGDVFMSFL